MKTALVLAAIGVAYYGWRKGWFLRMTTGFGGDAATPCDPRNGPDAYVTCLGMRP